MGVRRVTAAEAIERLGTFDAVIDARSQSEYAEDGLPGAVNWPTLDDAERAVVGTEYKQASAFDARKRGAVLAARNIARHIEEHAQAMPRGWKPLVYCWRGGQRSGALATVLGAIGFEVAVVEGGYRAFRREVLTALETAAEGIALRVLCGPTGSGKSRLLGALAETGAQVLDLEGLAQHRGSVLGAMPDTPQPSQKHFETLVWQALRSFDRARPVFVESESRLVGRLRLPERLLEAMRAAPCVRLELPMAERVALLTEDYHHFVADTTLLCARLAQLRELRGAAVVERWQALAQAGQIAPLVQELLEQHYDPTYLRSTRQNYERLSDAEIVQLDRADAAALARAAAALAGR